MLKSCFSLLVVGVVVFSAGCGEDTGATAPRLDADGAAETVQLPLSCRASLRAGTLSCEPAEPGLPKGVSGAVYGGQGRYVYLEATNVRVVDSIFSADVSVRNFLAQTLGVYLFGGQVTRDGNGVRIFFDRLPVVTKTAEPSGGEGGAEVRVRNPSGTGTFTSTGQPYFQYDQVLSPGKTSLPKTWEFVVTEGVEEFGFGVYVSPRLVDEANIVDGLQFRGQTIAAGGYHSCALAVNGRLACWGKGNEGQTARGGDGRIAGYTIRPTQDTIVTGVSAGLYHTCGLTSSGKLYCWGLNEYGQLGDNSTQNKSSPSLVSSSEVFVAVSAGWNHTCAVTVAGKVFCWGYNGYGKLGVGGSGGNYLVPTQVNDASNSTFVSVSAGTDHTCAVTDAGRIYCWGSNMYGQLGSSGVSYTPVAINDGSNSTFVAVAAGHEHTCGLADTGKVYCWGRNSHGQLGDGTTNNSNTPVQVADTTGSTFAMVTAGYYYTCAVNTAGRAYCWGMGQNGRLGTGGTDNHSQPFPVASQPGPFSSISAGLGQHTCGLITTGQAYCWGDDGFGQLGNGAAAESSNSPSPVVASGISFVAHLDGRSEAGGAVKPFPWRSFESYVYAARAEVMRTGTV